MDWARLSECFHEALLTLSDELFVMLRECLLERSRDKESAVRVQAALALAKLQSADDEEVEDEESIAQVLLDLLRYDPAA